MASRKPVIHGSDHLPGHSDPIPGLTIGGGGGIQFDTNPQAGTWLYVETTGNVAGVGMQFTLDSSSAFRVGAGGFTVDMSAGGTFDITGTDFTFLDAGLGPPYANFQVAVGKDIAIGGGGGSLYIRASGVSELTSTADRLQLYGTPDVVIRGITPAGAFPRDILVVTHDPAGILPPTYHIQTGATWAADLP